MAKTTPTYGEALTTAQSLLRKARLADPDEHFPYRHPEASDLVANNPPMGPNGPKDDSFRAEDYMTQDIANASGSYIAAQAAYLRDPGDATRADYESAKSDLVAARRAHRANRGQAGPIQRARRAGE